MQLINGTTVRELCEIYGLSSSAINRHKANKHIPHELAQALQGEPLSEGLPAGTVLMNQIRDMRKTALELLHEAETTRDKTALLKEIREQIKLMADIMLKSIELDAQKKQDEIVVHLHWD